MISAEQQLRKDMGRAIHDHRLINDGDRIMVAMSGGKDSYALCVLLSDLRKRAPVDFSLVAVHIDQGQPGYDGTPLQKWLADFGIEHRIIREDTYSIVIDKISEGKTYCSLCSRLRRGVLYRVAEELSCNKIALGHHRDDALETLLLNLFFAGKLAAMPAKLTNDKKTCEVIRPLIYSGEDTLRVFAAEQAFPIMPCNLCGSQSQAQRKQMKALLDDLQAKNPVVRKNMLAALSNVRATQLLDQNLLSALSAELPTAAEETTTATPFL